MSRMRIIRTLTPAIVAASDGRIAQVVALIDALPQRGTADYVLAPHRARIARLMLPRPLTFNRLVFMPLDSLIVPPAAWRPGGVTIPRTALAPIASALRAVMPIEAEAIDAKGRQGTRLDDGVVVSSTWTQAAAALDVMTVPNGWADATGLPDQDFSAIATAAAGGLDVAAAIQRLAIDDTPMKPALRRILARTIPRGGVAIGAVVAILLARDAAAGSVLALGVEASGGDPAWVDLAVDHNLDLLQAALLADKAIGLLSAEAAQDFSRIIRLLEAIDPTTASRPDRRRRMDRLRREAGTQIGQRFSKALETEFVALLEALPWNASDDDIDRLENAARDVRRLHGLMGSAGQEFQAVLDQLHSPGGKLLTGKLRETEFIRLLEILCGQTKVDFSS